MEQPELIEDLAAKNPEWLKPSERRKPAFWISEIRLLRQLSSDKSSEIRRVKLNKGLNIVWSPPGDPNGPERERGRGHGAGKTSFCRVIRYLLGEDHFGNKFISSRFANSQNLKRAYAVAQIWIGDTAWMVARPLYQGGRHFAIAHTNFDEGIKAEPSQRISHEEWLTILREAIVFGWPIKHFDKKQERPIQWSHLIQAITRDQECHLSSLHNWRNPSSGAESPEMSDNERAFLMRCLLGLADSKENKELENRAKQNGIKKTSEADLQFYGRLFVESLESLRASLQGLPKEVAPDDELFVNTVADLARSQAKSKIDAIKQLIANLNLAELRNNKDGKRQEIAKINGRIEERVEALVSLKKKLESHAGKKDPTPKDDEELRQALLQNLKKTRRCEVPIDIAIKECKLYWRLGITPESTSNVVDDYSTSAVTKCKVEIKTIEEELSPHLKQISDIEKEITEIDKLIKKSEKVEDDYKKSIQDIYEEPGDHMRLARTVNEAVLKRMDLQQKIKNAEESVNKSDELLEEIRQGSIDNQNQISNIFDVIVKQIAGSHIQAKLRFTKVENNAIIIREGEVVSEAFNAVKALAYDFTALVTWLNKLGHHPGFLLHDSPRESDMEASLYQPYLKFVSQLAEDSPDSFQYIVTTTEPPPISLQSIPPVCLTLDGSNQEGSLYKEIL